MIVKRITPVLFVKQIEPVLPFWVDALGFEDAFDAQHLLHLILDSEPILEGEREMSAQMHVAKLLVRHDACTEIGALCSVGF